MLSSNIMNKNAGLGPEASERWAETYKSGKGAQKSYLCSQFFQCFSFYLLLKLPMNGNQVPFDPSSKSAPKRFSVNHTYIINLEVQLVVGCVQSSSHWPTKGTQVGDIFY